MPDGVRQLEKWLPAELALLLVLLVVGPGQLVIEHFWQAVVEFLIKRAIVNFCASAIIASGC